MYIFDFGKYRRWCDEVQYGANMGCFCIYSNKHTTTILTTASECNKLTAPKRHQKWVKLWQMKDRFYVITFPYSSFCSNSSFLFTNPT